MSAFFYCSSCADELILVCERKERDWKHSHPILTLCSTSAPQDAIGAIAAEHGQWSELALSETPSADEIAHFHRLIPDKSFRLEMLHHCTTMHVNSGIYLEATRRGVVYTVTVTFHDAHLSAYEDFLTKHLCPVTHVFHNTGLSEEIAPIRDAFASLDDVGFAVDETTYLLQFALWKTLAAMADSKPVPALKQIFPALANTWNHLKGSRIAVCHTAPPLHCQPIVQTHCTCTICCPTTVGAFISGAP